MTDAVLCQLCADVYRRDPSQEWQAADDIELLDTIADTHTDTQLAIFRQLDALAVVFRGTSSLRDIITDADYRMIAIGGGRAHEGFWRAWDSVALDVAASVRQPGISRIVFTGHSLGGALAVLGGSLLGAEIVTFGAPRVFDWTRAREVANCRQYRHRRDPAPHCPPWWHGYRHAGKAIKLGRRGFFRVKYHKISNYLRFF